MPTDRLATGWLARYGVLAVSVALSLACQCYLVARSPVIAKDGIRFIQIAQSLASDPAAALRTYDQHPGYPAMVLACQRLYHAVTGENEFQSFIAGTQLASGACGLLVLIFLWLFARSLYDERIANVTALLAAVWPLFRHSASNSLSDTPHLMFYLASAWLACEGFRRRRVAWFAGAVLVSGLAFWVRPEGLVVAAATILTLAFNARRQLVAMATCKRPNDLTLASGTHKRILSLFAIAAAGLFVVAPYVLVAGKFTSKKLPFVQTPPSAHAVAIATTQPTPGLLSEPAPGTTLPDEFARPSKLIGVVALGLVELGRELAQGFYYLALIPLAAGTFMPGRQKPSPPAAVFHIFLMNVHAALLMLLYLTAGYISHRHIMPLVAVMLPTTAAGTVWLADQASRRLAVAGSPRRALAVAVAIFYLGLVPKCLVPLQERYLPVWQAAQWVKQHARPGDSVLSTSGYVRFYTQLPGILVGSEAPNLPIAFYFAPNKVWPFIVLEFDERSFDRQSLCGSAGGYDEVLEIDAHPRKPWAKVAVFRSRSLTIAGPSRLAKLPAK